MLEAVLYHFFYKALMRNQSSEARTHDLHQRAHTLDRQHLRARVMRELPTVAGSCEGASVQAVVSVVPAQLCDYLCTTTGITSAEVHWC
jgi:hypothetical protein